jgi:putative transposase
MIDFKGHCSEKDLILICVRWYLFYPLSYRNLANMMEERGIEVDHSTIYCWVRKFTPKLEAIFRKGKKRPVGSSWRMDETYLKIKGKWWYIYWAVDKEGWTLDFLLAAHRDKSAALRFLKMDKSGANRAALEALKEETSAGIEICQSKYLNNRVEQDHRAVKKIFRLMLGFKSLRSARITLARIGLIPRIKKGQRLTVYGQDLFAAEQFYALAT